MMTCRWLVHGIGAREGSETRVYCGQNCGGGVLRAWVVCCVLCCVCVWLREMRIDDDSQNWASEAVPFRSSFSLRGSPYISHLRLVCTHTRTQRQR